MQNLTLDSAVLQTIVALAPSFLVLVFTFIILSWLRVLVDHMSGRGI